jgi:hypothetical protein
MLIVHVNRSNEDNVEEQDRLKFVLDLKNVIIVVN